MLELALNNSTTNFCHLNTCQGCVDQWRLQANIHALAWPAPLTSIQLLRFHEDDQGLLQRNVRQVPSYYYYQSFRPGWNITNDTELMPLPCHFLAYEVLSMALHFGARPSEGHYRASLCGRSGFGGERGGSLMTTKLQFCTMGTLMLPATLPG